MATAAHRDCGFAIAFAAAVLAASHCRAETITVELASGRMFKGEVDSRTDDSRLWLRFGEGRGVVLRPIAWDRIVRALHDERELTADELRTLAQKIGSPRSKETLTTLEELPPYSGGQPVQAAAAYPFPSIYGQPIEQVDLCSIAKVRAIHVEAYLANWDADVEADGLVVQVFPMDDYGRTVPVNGTLEVTLIGEQPVYRRDPFTRLARWSRQLLATQVGPEGGYFKLPFQAIHPAFDTDTRSIGLVHARLSVPGHGVFEDSATAVRIRPYSALRDDLQQWGNQRYFPIERTGRGNRFQRDY